MGKVLEPGSKAGVCSPIPQPCCYVPTSLFQAVLWSAVTEEVWTQARGLLVHLPWGSVCSQPRGFDCTGDRMRKRG